MMRVGWVIALLVVVVTAKECAYRAPGSDDFYDLSPLVAASDAPLDAFLSGTSDDLGLFYLNLCCATLNFACSSVMRKLSAAL